MRRPLLAAFVVVLGAACGCRSSEGILAAPSPTSSKANLPLPETTPRWGAPCLAKLIRVNSWGSPGHRVDWFANFCGDNLLRITDSQGERWVDWYGNPVPRPW